MPITTCKQGWAEGFVVVDAVEVSYGISDGDTSNPGSASPESRVWSGHGPTHRTTQVRKIARITQRHRRQAGKTRTGSVGKRRRSCRRGSTTTLTSDECQRAWTDQPSQNGPQRPDRLLKAAPTLTPVSGSAPAAQTSTHTEIQQTFSTAEVGRTTSWAVTNPLGDQWL